MNDKLVASSRVNASGGAEHNPIGPKSNILISSDFDNENQAIAKA
jgi:hypothetical protein